MTEYETATLAIQQSSLAIQQAGLEISRAGLEISRAELEISRAELEISRLGLWAQIVIGVVQCVLIAGGLWIMRMAAITRDNQHEEAKDRHEETMLALRVLIERTAPRPANDG